MAGGVSAFVRCAEQLLRLGLREVAAIEQLFEQLTRKRHARLQPLAQRGARRGEAQEILP